MKEQNIYSKNLRSFINTSNIITPDPGKCLDTEKGIEQTKQYVFIPPNSSYLNVKWLRNVVMLKHKTNMPSSHHIFNCLCRLNRIPLVLSKSLSQLFLLIQLCSFVLSTDLHKYPHETAFPASTLS